MANIWEEDVAVVDVTCDKNAPTPVSQGGCIELADVDEGALLTSVFNVQQEIDDGDNAVSLEEGASDRVSLPRTQTKVEQYVLVNGAQIHKSSYLNLLLASEAPEAAGVAKKSYDRVSQVAGAARYRAAKTSAVQRAADFAAEHVRRSGIESDGEDSSDGEDGYMCKYDVVALLVQGKEMATSLCSVTCLAIGRVVGVGAKDKAPCEYKIPIGERGFTADVEVEQVEKFQSDKGDLLHTTGKVAFALSNVESHILQAINPQQVFVEDEEKQLIRVNVMEVETLNELKAMLVPKRQYLAPFLPIKFDGRQLFAEVEERKVLAPTALTCDLCSPPQKLSFQKDHERCMRNHVALHICEGWSGMPQEPCGQCGSQVCSVTVKKKAKSQIHEVHVECATHKFSPFNIKGSTKITGHYPSTNHPVRCMLCLNCVWSYNLVRHYQSNHDCSVPDEVVEELPFK